MDPWGRRHTSEQDRIREGAAVKNFATRGRRLAASGPGVSGSQSLDVRSGLPHRFEALGEALVSGSDVLEVCSVAGQDLARDGASVEETLEGLRGTWHRLTGADPGKELGDLPLKIAADIFEAYSESSSVLGSKALH